MKDILQPTFQAYSEKVVSDLVGTSYETYDCWGVIKEFYKRHGVTLKDYYDIAPNDQNISGDYIDDAKRKDFIQVFDPEIGDIAIIQIMGINSHCALVLDKKNLLHSLKNLNCVIEPIKKYSKRIVGYYRPKLDD